MRDCDCGLFQSIANTASAWEIVEKNTNCNRVIQHGIHIQNPKIWKAFFFNCHPAIEAPRVWKYCSVDKSYSFVLYIFTVFLWWSWHVAWFRDWAHCCNSNIYTHIQVGHGLNLWSGWLFLSFWWEYLQVAWNVLQLPCSKSSAALSIHDDSIETLIQHC